MILRRYLNDLSIQKKLIYSNMFGIAIAFIPVISIIFGYELYALRKAMLEDIRVQAQIVSESSAAAMAFRDKDAARDTLISLRRSKDVEEAHLILEDSTVLTSYIADSQPNPLYVAKIDPVKSYIEDISLRTVIVHQPIFLRSQYVGTLVLINSLNTFYKRLQFYSIVIIAATILGFILASLVASRISKTITEPLLNLLQATQRVTQEQNYTTPISINSHDELGNLSKAFGEMMSQIHKRDLSMQQLAYYDRVTGIPNRHYFEERIAQAVNNAQRYGTHCYLMMIDLDDFKKVNDNLGHHAGDILLRHVSEVLTRILRQNDALFRIGGDEFAIIIESTSDHESVGKIAEKIIHAISKPMLIDGHEAKVGASIGISCYPRFSNDIATLMNTADAAMYVAKGEGKNNFKIYTPNFRMI